MVGWWWQAVAGAEQAGEACRGEQHAVAEPGRNRQCTWYSRQARRRGSGGKPGSGGGAGGPCRW